MDRKTFPLQRWLNVVLRGLHLVVVIWLGAALLGAPVSGGQAALGVAATGVVMFALDTWSEPSHLRKVSGFAVLIKLVLVAWMAADESSRLVLFWVIVSGSAVFAHAPARFRHAILFVPRQ
jgi:hypothetical protein